MSVHDYLGMKSGLLTKLSCVGGAISKELWVFMIPFLSASRYIADSDNLGLDLNNTQVMEISIWNSTVKKFAIENFLSFLKKFYLSIGLCTSKLTSTMEEIEKLTKFEINFK